MTPASHWPVRRSPAVALRAHLNRCSHARQLSLCCRECVQQRNRIGDQYFIRAFLRVNSSCFLSIDADRNACGMQHLSKHGKVMKARKAEHCRG